MLDWIYEGNNYGGTWGGPDNTPVHPQLPLADAKKLCILTFPDGILRSGASQTVGMGWRELLPGTYEYLGRGGDKRVADEPICWIVVNLGTPQEDWIDLIYGEPFKFKFYTYHGMVQNLCWYTSGLHRIGD